MTKTDETTTTSLLILVFIALLIAKALDYDIPWGIVTAPIWGRMLYFIVVELVTPKSDNN